MRIKHLIILTALFPLLFSFTANADGVYVYTQDNISQRGCQNSGQIAALNFNWIYGIYDPYNRSCTIVAANIPNSPMSQTLQIIDVE